MGCRRKTRPGRLDALDALLQALEGPLLARRDGDFHEAPVVDLGIGAHPWTTLALVEAVAPLRVVGVDHAPELVEAARREAPGLELLVGGFSLPVMGARLVRVMNVLRDLQAHEVPGAHRQIGEAVLPGGLVIEGSCGPEGEAGVAHWLRRAPGGLQREALVFWVSGAKGTAPMALRDRLPRDLRGRRDHPVGEVLERWMAAYRAVGAREGRWRRAIEASGVRGLEAVGELGARWAPPGGVP